MPIGKPINRHSIYVLKDGTPVIDWDDGLVQDLLSGDFLHCSRGELNHAIREDELEMLIRAGRVEGYDARQVYVYALPEPPRRTLD